MNPKQDIRNFFLEEFIKRMIIRAVPRTRAVNDNDSLISKMEKTSKASPVLKITTKFEETPPHLTKEFLMEENTKPEEIKKIDIISVPQKTKEPLISKIINISQPQEKINPSIVQSSIGVMEKLKNFIKDSTINSITCPGPEKMVIITKLGKQQETKIKLNKEEIKSFIKNLSEKTKTPLLPGVFKVTYQNLIITAIISDYIETKFIIEKKSNVSNYQQYQQRAQPPRQPNF